MPKYRIAVFVETGGYIEVEAKNEAQALEMVEDSGRRYLCNRHLLRQIIADLY